MLEQAVSDGTHSVQTDTLYVRKKKNPQDTESNAGEKAGPAHNAQNVPPQDSSEIIIPKSEPEVKQMPTAVALAAHDAAEQERIRQEELFAEIERDWYEGEERPVPDEESKDEWEEIVAEEIERSVGAKAKNYDVYNPITGENMHLTEGTRITQPQNHVIAGKGRERQIDELPFLIDRWGGDPLEWTKEKGFGYVDDEFGDSHLVELHWYQEPTTGKHKMKIKVQPDGRIYLDED